MNSAPSKMFKVLLAGLTSAIYLSGCSLLATQPDLANAQGSYVLQAVDGVSLPVAIESGDCPREIFSGDLALSPGAVDQRPLYNLLVSVRLRCDPDKLLFIDDRRFVEDFGEWTLKGDKVELRSSKGFGTFQVPLDSVSSASGPTITLGRGGKLYTFRRIRN